MLMKNLSNIARQMRVFSERKLSSLDVGFSELMVLMYLSSNENVNQEHISRYFEVDKGAIAKTIKKLEEKSLITRVENTENKREKLLKLSEAANPIIENLKETLNEWNTCIYKGLTDEDIQKFNLITEVMAINSMNLINEKRGN